MTKENAMFPMPAGRPRRGLPVRAEECAPPRKRRGRPDYGKIARLGKTVLFTLFAVYAAMNSEEALLKDHMHPDLLYGDWYWKFVFWGKYAYGMASGLVFYVFLSHKQDEKRRRFE